MGGYANENASENATLRGAMVDELNLLRAERDLYQRLLELGAHDELEPLLDEALSLAVSLTGAKKGYLAVEAAGGPSLVLSEGCSAEDVGAIQAELSRGIIAEALRTGKTVNTASARSDPRFAGLASVQAQKLEAVLCAPVGGERKLAVLYLAGRSGAGPFGEREQRLVETFARGLGAVAQRLLDRRGREGAQADATLPWRARLRAEGIVGRSAALARALELLVVAAGTDLGLLVLGESGVGKTAFARAVHDSSARARGPFVELSCAALPETLAEAELFGAEKGAHSTATRRMPGKIAAAERGTLFLDEVAELPLSVQAKLLGFLQSKRYFPLGSDVEARANVRIVAATNADLEGLVAAKRFREDLYYRLNVLSVRVPPLRERMDDVPQLAEHFASLEGDVPLSFAARAALSATEWPGNVRELGATVQRGAAFARSEGAPAIEPRHLFPDRKAGSEPEAVARTWQDATRGFQERLLRETLEACGGNVSEAARRLDLSRSRLHELLRAHGLVRGKAP